MSSPPVLELQSVTAGYHGRPVLHDVTLTVARGEVVAILGANGSGKSTLVRAALGLLPLLAGAVRVFGSPLAGRRDRHRIGYVPQRLGVGGGVPATVTELVNSGRLARRRIPLPRRAADRRAVAEAIAQVGLADHRDQLVTTLSGGQQQRALIARALATEPELLVLDEPTAGVDLASQAAFAEALAGFVADGGTVVLVAHELGPLEPLINRVVLLHEGRVAQDRRLPAPGASDGPASDGRATYPPLPAEEATHPHAPGDPARRWHPPGRWLSGPISGERKR